MGYFGQCVCVNVNNMHGIHYDRNSVCMDIICQVDGDKFPSSCHVTRFDADFFPITVFLSYVLFILKIKILGKYAYSVILMRRSAPLACVYGKYEATASSLLA